MANLLAATSDKGGRKARYVTPSALQLFGNLSVMIDVSSERHTGSDALATKCTMQAMGGGSACWKEARLQGHVYNSTTSTFLIYTIFLLYDDIINL